MELKTALPKIMAAAAAVCATTQIHAGDAPYPSKTVTIVVPYPAGGSSDTLTRAVARGLSELWHRNVVVDNRPGASSMIGAEYVANAAPDGYRLLTATSSYPATVALRTKLPFDPVGAFVPVAMYAQAPFVFAVHPSVPARTVKEFIALAKQRLLTYSSTGTGSSNQFAMELLSEMAGIKMTHIPYKGSGPAVLALVSGEIECGFSSAPTIMGQVKAGKVRAIAVSSAERAPLIPGLPTIAESGVPGFAFENWFGLVAPARTPSSIVSALNTAVNNVLKSAETKQLLDQEGAGTKPMSVAELADLLPKEIALYRKMAQAAGIKPE